jgi:hypothetical protein
MSVYKSDFRLYILESLTIMLRLFNRCIHSSCCQLARPQAAPLKTVQSADRPNRIWRQGLCAVALSSAAGLLGGCARSIPSLQSLEPVDLKLQVEPGAERGVYDIAAQTNLPDETKMVVLAVRQLRPSQPVTTATPPAYAILAYQSVKVDQGSWQTELNLWQVAADGSYREAWQIEADRLNLSLEPESEVEFIATLAPEGVLTTLEEGLEQKGLRLPRPFLRTTLEGDRFLQVEQALVVGLPTGQTKPPVVLPEDLNGGWGKRYLLVPEPPLPYTLEPEDTRKTNAPVAAEEYMF